MSVKYVYWEEDGGWLGYLEEYPDYWTQGDSLDDLQEHLRDLKCDLESKFIVQREAKEKVIDSSESDLTMNLKRTLSSL